MFNIPSNTVSSCTLSYSAIPLSVLGPTTVSANSNVGFSDK